MMTDDEIRGQIATWVLVPIALFLIGPILVGQQSAAPVPEQPSVTFRTEANFVEVDAIVTDADGNFATGLTPDDFEIYENGDLQSVESFGVVNMPTETIERPLFADRPIEPDVATNARDYDGRLFLVVLDDLHTAALRSKVVKDAARRFIEHNVGRNDQVAIIYTSGRSDASQPFTTNQTRLLASVDAFVGRKLRSRTLERLDEYERLRRQGRLDETPFADLHIPDPLDSQRGVQAQAMLRTLKASAELLSNIRGRRKTLLLISEGLDYDVNEQVNSRSSRSSADRGPSLASGMSYSSTVLEDVREVIAAASRGNVAIYSIDPSGLASGLEGGIERLVPSRPVVDINPQSLARDVRIAQDSLRVFAEETGGIAFVASTNVAAAFEQVVLDNSSYYMLGYRPTNETRNGGFRAIEVRVTRPGLEVRARKGYVAPTGRPSEPELLEVENTSRELREVLSRPLQVSGLTMAATAAAFRGENGEGSVAVTIQVGGSNLAFTENDGRFANTLEIAIVALDRDGSVRGGDQHEVAMALEPETYQLVRSGGMRLQSRLSLRPGRYQLRVAGREAEGGKLGSVYLDLEVPDFSDNPLVMSDPVLTSIEAMLGTATVRGDEALAQLLPGPPTTDREFSAEDEIVLFVDLYDNETTRPHTVDITTSVLSTEGTVVFQTEAERDSSELGGRPGGYGHSATVPLERLSPGLYVLRVEARFPLTPDAAVRRDVPFRVRPGTARALTAAALPPARPTLDPSSTLLDRATAYVTGYAEQLSSVVAEERYEQRVEAFTLTGRSNLGLIPDYTLIPAERRRLVSDYLLVKVPQMDGWTPFRDVLEVDGKPVRDRGDRLMTLFVESGGRGFDQAARIARESSRYNVGSVRRTINVPTLPLTFLLDNHRHRFRFALGKERRIEGRMTRELAFTESSSPSHIRAAGKDVMATGAFWIDPDSGLIVQTRVRTDDRGLRSEITVTYRLDDRLALWVPWQMREEYDSNDEHIEGTATYANFRKFRVDTEETLKR